MTFSQFAQALYPFCNEGASKAEYIKHLVDKIMDGQPGRAYGDDKYQNPVRAEGDRVLLNYFNGRNSIPFKSASAIYRKIKLEKFEKYISRHCSEDAQAKLWDTLLEMEDLQEKKNMSIPEACAKLFDEILYDLVKKPKK